MKELTTRLGELTCRIVDSGPVGAPPRAAVVLCHGFGAPGDDLVPLAHELTVAASPPLERVRFVFPEAPLALRDYGLPFGRAWWLIDIGRMQSAFSRGALQELREDVPDGMAHSRRLLSGCIEALARASGLTMDRIAVGGFSQGSMLAVDLALRAEEAPAALFVLSGALLSESAWRARARARTGLPVFQSHGRQDPVLPFLAGEWLRDMFVECGVPLQFASFNGGHAIPHEALVRVRAMIDSVWPT